MSNSITSFYLIFVFTCFNLFSQENIQKLKEIDSIDLNKAYFPRTILGIELKESMTSLENKKIGLLTNNASRIGSQSTAHYLAELPEINLTALYVPEHGFYTSVKAGEHVENEELFGIPVYSLYGTNRRPSKEYLEKCEIILIDIQDIGIRSYTYISTVYNMLDAASEHGKKVIVVDRPNPLGMEQVDGNVAEIEKLNFVSKLPVPYLHGMTIGELCFMINEEGWLPNSRRCDLEVLPIVENYGIDEKEWVPTSPHIPTVNSIRGAATLGVIGELGMISIGIGTTSPFQYLGAPDFDTRRFADAVKKHYPGYVYENESMLQIEGVKLLKTRFQPFYGIYSGKQCEGYYLKFELNTSNNRKRYFTAGIAILFALKVSHPEYFDKITDHGKGMFKKVTGTDKLWDSLEANSPYIFKNAKAGLEDFKKLREKYLIYDR